MFKDVYTVYLFTDKIVFTLRFSRNERIYIRIVI